ncbi:KCNMB3 [Branchiostoma lanceolatum]|uniref:KCNMB3 protein n=1 Tax=Branchiostoma lanceolatum TaxID=7740 RepID=A0A8J9VC05_BRALA|nr:KCNMB3 [Branchiostoma lanceolatum]
MADDWEMAQKCGGFVALVSVAALILTGALVVHPMLQGSTLSYRPTSCTTAYSYTAGGETCHCGKNCKSVARCLVVMVTINNSSSPALLVQSEEVLRVSDECSLYYCLRDRDYMDRLLEEFQETYGQQGQTYPCLYNPQNTQKVLLERIYDEWSIFHALFWAGLIFVLFCCCCLCVPGGLARRQQVKTQPAQQTYIANESGLG